MARSVPAWVERARIDGAQYALAVRAFLLLLGLSYVSAFVSFGAQAKGLIGPDGIWPLSMTLEWARQAGGTPWLAVPSVLWLWPTDAGLIAACAGGAACGVALAVAARSRVAAVLAWALYLSLVSVGGIFFGYQWDSLLLEMGFLAIVLAPWRRSFAAPSGVGILLGRLVLFRLMFMSGVVKLASGDPTWRSLSGLQFHYWSQPLPTWSSYLVDLLPTWFDRSCEAAMFGIELCAPFLLFGPRPVRRGAVAAMVALQLAIAATGNYGFFNLLTVALCALQLDDGVWRRLRIPERWWRPSHSPVERPRIARAGWAALGALLTVFGAMDITSRLWRAAPWPSAVVRLADALEPFRLVGRYGLFAVMTTQREEIELDGSDDGEIWRPYRFHYKPGPLDRRPAFAPLHMPRVDWQMWFASLGSCGQNEWLLLLQKRLLEGAPRVQGLFDEDPFPRAPPRFVRTRIAPYRFAPAAAWWKDGTYWTRGAERDYCPPLTLEQGQLRRAGPLMPSAGP